MKCTPYATDVTLSATALSTAEVLAYDRSTPKHGMWTSSFAYSSEEQLQRRYVLF